MIPWWGWFLIGLIGGWMIIAAAGLVFTVCAYLTAGTDD